MEHPFADILEAQAKGHMLRCRVFQDPNWRTPTEEDLHHLLVGSRHLVWAAVPVSTSRMRASPDANIAALGRVYELSPPPLRKELLNTFRQVFEGALE